MEQICPNKQHKSEHFDEEQSDHYVIVCFAQVINEGQF